MSEETKDDLKTRLTGRSSLLILIDIQYRVTQNAATEPPFTGEFFKHTTEGLYNCVVCHK